MPRAAIFLIIFAAVALRFWRINAPFDDRWSWRQSDVAAIARNYFENGFHFTRPQIDWAGDQPGFVGTEFPLLPFIAALLYPIFGVHEWIGRTLTILFFAGSLPFMFALTRRPWGELSATLAVIFYSFAPLSVAASRAFIPDMASLTCALAGVYYFWRSLDSPAASATSRLYLVIATAALAFAFLLKPTTVVIAAPLLAIAWEQSGIRALLRPAFWMMGLSALAPSVFWYAHAARISREYYPHHMFGAGGLRVMDASWYWHIFVLTFTSSLTPVFFLLALVGIVKPTRTRAFHWWLLAMFLFILVVGYGNRHEWYRLALVPIAAAFAGAALSSFPRTGHIAAILGLFAGFSMLATPPYLAPASASLCQLGREVREHTSPGALVVIADEGDPTALYYAHRRGWHFLERDGIYDGNPRDDEHLIASLQSLRARGATHIAFYSGSVWWLDYYAKFAEYLARTGSLVSASADHRIYKLNTDQ